MTLQKTIVMWFGCWCLMVGSAATAAAQAVVRVARCRSASDDASSN